MASIQERIERVLHPHTACSMRCRVTSSFGSINSTQDASVLRAAHMYTARHVIRVRSFFFHFYVVRICLHVQWVFDSGEFVLKLNASLNSSLCKSIQRYSVHSTKTHIYSEKERQQKEEKRNKKRKYEIRIVCSFFFCLTSAVIY